MRTLSVAICLAVLTCHAETTRSKKCEEMHFDMGADAVSPNSAWKLTMTESKVSGPYEVRIRFRATPPLFVDKYFKAVSYGLLERRWKVFDPVEEYRVYDDG